MNTKNSADICMATCLALSLLLPRSGWAVERQILKGHIPMEAAHLRPIGRLPASERLTLAIGLPLRTPGTLAGLLDQLYDPASSQFRHYLTPQQFTEKFGPAKEDYEALKVFLESQGLAVAGTHPNRTLLDVSGSVQDIERAFQVTLQVYQHPSEARTFHAPDGEPSLDLALRVMHISGLDNFNVPRPLSHRVPLGPNRRGKALGGSAPGGGFIGKDFRTAYVPGVALTGAGQSVALVAYAGYYASDIKAYESLAGLPNVPLQNVLLDGFDGASASSEVALDIEMAISMAPGLSQVIVYEGSVDNHILNRIATDNAARQISSSYKLSFDATSDQIFQQYAAQGQSFFQASGDEEAYPSGWVADDPFITIVGGTELSTSGPAGARVSEAVWNLGYVLGTGSSGSGGGISPTYSIPTWQQGLSMVANHGSTVQRNSPDVAMVADHIWVVANNGDSFAQWGTSAAAPLWAGFAALANQLAEAHGQPPVGFINPAIYALGNGANYNSAFHDITTGNNNSSSHTGFPAVPGYDLCTGWGSPNGSNLLYALALPQRLQIIPGTNSTAIGPAGGPFSPSALSYSLTNSGAAALDWTLAYAASWLDTSASSGILAPAAPATTVTLSLNSAANNLPPGSYTVNVRFTNRNDGSVQTRSFMLAVFAAPVIITEPVSQAVPEGGRATFTVVAAGNAPLTYAWNRDGVFLTDARRISGSSTSTLIVSNVSSADEGTYGVVVSNNLGSVTNAGGMLAVIPVTAPGITLTILYSFTAAHDGANPASPSAPLVQASDGNLYGTAISGGAYGDGTVFRITTNGALSTLHAFSGGNDGVAPAAGLIQAADGNLYGTTYGGGTSGYGTVFRMSLNGPLTIMHAFNYSDGAALTAGLVQATNGNFYGTNWQGGGSGSGTVFKMTPNGTVTSLHVFNGTDGALPLAGLLLGNDGNLYGTTQGGGTYGDGIVFRITSTGTPTTLFNGGNGFDSRFALVRGSDGNFYGTTVNDGTNRSGTVFRITPAGQFTTLYSFTGNSDGQAPFAALVEGKDGYFYGTTSAGGTYGDGTVFRMTPNGVLATLLYFDGFNGANPSAPLVQASDGNFYGTTINGGENGFGTVFRLSVPPPYLSIVMSGSSLFLSWPWWAADLVLQQTSDLVTGNWTTVTAPSVVTNLQNQVTLTPRSSGNTFYRLTH